MTYLVDANVLSEPTKKSPNPKIIAWLSENEDRLILDPVVLGELCIGILAPAAGRQRTQLERWFEALVQTVECLPWEADVSRRWAQLVVELKREGKTLPVLDSMIAATALQHGLTVATRIVGHFKQAGVKVVDPFV
jgi:toxin FitB